MDDMKDVVIRTWPKGFGKQRYTVSISNYEAEKLDDAYTYLGGFDTIEEALACAKQALESEDDNA